jgi:ACS family hexuronate transporter-like MFS transporter
MSDPPKLPALRAWAITLVATATMAISYLDRQVLSVLAPTITDELDIDEESYGWLQSAFSLAYLVAAPFAGRLLELVGVRRGLLVAVLVWTLVSASHALVPGFHVLFAMRLALGLAESPSFPGSAAAIAKSLPPETRARGMGVLFTGSSFGAMVAPPLATAFSAALGGWRGAFVGVAIVGLLWVPLWLAVTGSRDVRELLGTGGAQAPSASREGGMKRSMLATLRHPAVLRACTLVLAVSPMFAFVLLWGAKYLVDVLDVDQHDVGSYLWLPPVLFDVGAVVFGVLASRYAAKHGTAKLPFAIVAVALAMALAIAALPRCSDPWHVAIVAGVAMAGGAGLFAILTADMITRVGAGLAATAGGLTAAAQSIAYVVANPLIGRGVDTFGTYDLVVAAIAVWMVPGALVWMATRRAGLPSLSAAESPLPEPALSDDDRER